MHAAGLHRLRGVSAVRDVRQARSSRLQPGPGDTRPEPTEHARADQAQPAAAAAAAAGPATIDHYNRQPATMCSRMDIPTAARRSSYPALTFVLDAP